MPDLAKPVQGAAANMRHGPGTREHSGRRTLPRAAAFWILAGLFLMLFFASAAASPLYPVYQARFRFSAATLTAVFAVYVLILLITLLFFGSVSDYLGRLPVIITALVFSAAACAVFLAAHGTGALYVARSLQGIATGVATGPLGAALIDLQPAGGQRAPVVTSTFSTLGLALGALITSALVQYAPAPTHLIWWALLAVFAAGIVAVLAMAEPGSRRPGALRTISSRAAMLAGCLFLLAGAAVTFAAIATATPAVFLAGTVVAGVGFGPAFPGAFRMTTAPAAPAERAGLLAAIFIVTYLAFSVPALIAGVATTKFGLHPTALVYSAVLAGLAAAAAGILLVRPGKTTQPAPASPAVMPPGPCTGPPCPQAIDPGPGR